MGIPNPNPPPALLFFGLLAGEDGRLEEAVRRLDDEFGGIDTRSAAIPFAFTDYYEGEMGPDLRRLWVCGGRLIETESIVEIKRRTNSLEADLPSSAAGGRGVNIDPGYVTAGKIVLATTKDHAHRVYLRDGIYAEATLRFGGNATGFQPWPWTYPDYRTPEALDFFNGARRRFMERAPDAAE